MSKYIYTYSVFLYSSSVCTVDDINKCKGLRQILCDYLIHDFRLTNSRTVNDYHAFLKDRELKGYTLIGMEELFIGARGAIFGGRVTTC